MTTRNAHIKGASQTKETDPTEAETQTDPIDDMTREDGTSSPQQFINIETSVLTALIEKIEQMSNDITELKNTNKKPEQAPKTHINLFETRSTETQRPTTSFAMGLVPNTDTTEHDKNEPTPDITSDFIHFAKPQMQQPNYKMYSRFLPSKISPRFVEQSMDQLESWLSINGIHDDTEKFWLLKLSLEPETYQMVSAHINNPPHANKFVALKSAILKTHTDSETKRIKSLLNDMALGDRRPTQLLAEMSNLYRGPRDRIFSEIFISRLPSTVRGILMGMQSNGTDMPLETMAQWADSIMEQIDTKNTINHITQTEQPRILEEAIYTLNDTINGLKQQENRLNNQNYYQPPAQPRGRPQYQKQNQRPQPQTPIRHNNPETQTTENSQEKNTRILTERRRDFSIERHDTCFYHRAYGRDSHTCRPPCRFLTKN